MKKNAVAVFCLLFGLTAGLLAGSSLGREYSTVIAGIVLVIGVLFLVTFWRTFERGAHLANLESWERHQARGKVYFIVTRYLLLRGGILTVLIIAPGWIISTISFTAFGYLAEVFVLLFLIMSILGHVEWTDCTREYQAGIMRDLGESAREESAQKN